jgi:hypothetical protein
MSLPLLLGADSPSIDGPDQRSRMSFSESFAQFARSTARVSGSGAIFGLAVFVIVVWAITGPVFHLRSWTS